MLPRLRRISRPFSHSLVFSSGHKTLAAPITSSVDSHVGAPPVAVFWDLHNRPPKSISPYDAAVRLRLAASSLGPLRFVAAYGTAQALRNVPSPVCISRLQDPAPSAACICRVCGRNFFVHSKLLNHFKMHEREHEKRLRRLDSATGGRYVRLKAQLSLKMDKFRKAAREVLIPRVGHGLGDELQRAGVSVRIVEDRPEAADRALREHMAETMDRRRVGCLVLVSNDTGFVGVIREARMRCMKTVVVGDDGDGALKRCADASFSWKEVVSGKARKEGPSAVVRWNDRDLLKKLEWRYEPESEPNESECNGSKWEDIDPGYESASDGCEDLMGQRVSKPWWKLD
ncbi:uncharacterized protein LOC110035153 [Phalaenopsis equestris]|uniref:uncharacterized protein LOC110035153 n=1 Tax=Phalaenopsis equestris TaxID=78828 RepID=UPI0009E4BC0A|nr:uncharacterized protein LOC110035153 [Phalaenopsis equestris]